MTPAETLPKLKRRIDDYLWREDGLPIQRLREILATKFEPLGPMAIIGGLVRDRVAGVSAAVCAARFHNTLARAAGMVPGGPVHIHIAEQVAEVTEVQAAWGARPVDWAVANLALDARWCMIHATQMTPDETAALARTEAVAGL